MKRKKFNFKIIYLKLFGGEKILKIHPHHLFFWIFGCRKYFFQSVPFLLGFLLGCSVGLVRIVGQIGNEHSPSLSITVPKLYVSVV